MRYIVRVVEEHTGRIVRSSELSCVLEALILEAKRVAAAAQISEIARDAAFRPSQEALDELRDVEFHVYRPEKFPK